MATSVLYHNPGCSKSRAALAILRERGVDFDVVDYLKAPLDRAALERLLDRLAVPPADLVRRDAHFERLQLAARDCDSRERVIELLLEHPRLMQRPIFVAGERAVIARPPEKLLGLL